MDGEWGTKQNSIMVFKRPPSATRLSRGRFPRMTSGKFYVLPRRLRTGRR